MAIAAAEFAPELLEAGPEVLGMGEGAVAAEGGGGGAFETALSDPAVRQALSQHFAGPGYPVDESYSGLWWFLNAFLFAAVIIFGYYIGTKLGWIPPLHFP